MFEEKFGVSFRPREGCELLQQFCTSGGNEPDAKCGNYPEYSMDPYKKQVDTRENTEFRGIFSVRTAKKRGKTGRGTDRFAKKFRQP
jgi:hypothetical protein